MATVFNKILIMLFGAVSIASTLPYLRLQLNRLYDGEAFWQPFVIVAVTFVVWNFWGWMLLYSHPASWLRSFFG